MTDNDWMTRALCTGADPDLWFPERGSNSHDVQPAIRICRECPVSRDCYELADRNNETHGIWGGVNFASKKNRRHTLLGAMNELWAAQGLTPVKPHTERRDAVILPMPAARTSLPRAQRGRQPQHGNESCWRRGCRCEDCTAWKARQDDRRRQAAAEAAS